MWRMTILAAVSGLLLAVSCTPAPDAPDEFREERQFLLAHGFKPMADLPGGYILNGAVLGDAASDLGFRVTDLKNAMQSPPSQVREVTAHGLRFTVEKAGDTARLMNPTPIDDPRRIVSLTVWLHKDPPPGLQSDSTLHVRITSVSVPKTRSGSLQVTFELSADGAKPLVVDRRWIQIRFEVPQGRADDIPSVNAAGWLTFSPGTPERISLAPGKPPLAFTATESSGKFLATFRRGFSDVERPWCDLPAGEYAVFLWVGEERHDPPEPRPPRFDYEFTGFVRSEPYKIVVKSP
jgi:hypothetical protein